MQIRNPLADNATLLETHILLDLFLQLRPEEVAGLMVLNKTFNAALSGEPFWQHAVERHFKSHFHILKDKPDINWLSTFGELHRKHYKKLPTRTKQLFSLTKEGDVQRLQELGLTENDLSLEDAHNKWPLHFYASTSNNHALHNYIYQKLLLPFYLDKNTINTRKKNNSSATLLHWAVTFNQKAEVDSLISKGADFNATTNSGATPLYLAAQNGHLATVEKLIARGANINAAHNSGSTPLFIAAENGHLAVVEMLIAKGANINAAHFTGATPLHIAAYNGHLAIVEALIAKRANINATINATINTGSTPLCYAAHNGHLAIVKAFIAKGANINVTLNDDTTPLHIAAEYGHLAVVEALIASGANINAVHNSGATPLYIAAQNGHLAVVEALIARGANINAALNIGATPLSIAKSNGHHAIVKVLSKIKLKEYIAETAALTNTYQTPLTLFGYTVRHTTEQILAAAIALKAVSEGADENILNEHQGALHQRGLKPLYRNLMRR